ncbi:MAG: Tol biopolymer transporter periplasmic protein [Cyanobacteria bacterium J083]|nr:MAG: Tol biopolymer transporter periplasmic protein [Cyanobacteria bacterium J083]
MTIKLFRSILLLTITSLLNGCLGYPQILNFTFDRGGRGLNSPASELEPQIAAKYIVFVSDRNGSQDIYLFDAKKRLLVDLPGLNSLNEIASHPSISEDGRYLVFMASYEGITDIYLYDRALQQKRNLTANSSYPVRNPTISANGSKIVYEIGINGQWDIRICDRTGKVLHDR